MGHVIFSSTTKTLNKKIKFPNLIGYPIYIQDPTYQPKIKDK